MARPIVIGSVSRKEADQLVTELEKIGHFSLVKRQEDKIVYHDGTMTKHEIDIVDGKSNLLIV